VNKHLGMASQFYALGRTKVVNDEKNEVACLEIIEFIIYIFHHRCQHHVDVIKGK